MIRYKDKKVVAYVGDHKPANVYHGTTAVALANKKTGSGQNNEFRTEYKTQPIKRIVGQSVQESGTKKAAHVMGKTSKWNQLLKLSNKSVSGLTCTISNHKAHIVGTTTGYAGVDLNNNVPFSTISSHKYFCYVNISGTTGTYGSGYAGVYLIGNETRVRSKTSSFIYDCSIADSTAYIQVIWNAINIQVDCEVECSLIDLTAIFGTGNEPSSTSEPRIQSLIAYAKEHPEYDGCSLKSVALNEVTYCGENLFDNSKQTFRLISGSVSATLNSNGTWSFVLGQTRSYFNEVGTGKYSEINGNIAMVKPNTVYYFGQNIGAKSCYVSFFDKDLMSCGTLYVSLYGGGTFTTPIDCAYVTVRIGFNVSSISNPYTGNWWITESSKVTQYSPYNGQTITFSTPVSLNGLATQDEIYSYVDNGYLVTKKVDRYENLVLKNYNWNRNSTYSTFFVQGNAGYKIGTTNLICPKYTTRAAGGYSTSAKDKSIWVNNTENRLYIKDDAYSDVNSFVASLEGVNLVIELATPIITEISRVPLTCDFEEVTNIIVSNENAGLADPDTLYSMDPFPTPYIPSEVVSSSKIDIQHNNHYYEIDGLTEKWNQHCYPKSVPVGWAWGFARTNDVPKMRGHKVLMHLKATVAEIRKPSTSNTMRFVVIASPNEIYGTYSVPTEEFVVGYTHTIDRIITVTPTATEIYGYSFGNDVEGATATANVEICCLDLTDIFGAGSEPTSVDDPRIQRLIEIAKRRPQYDAGSLLSASKIYDQDDNLIYDLDEPIRSAMGVTDVLNTDGSVEVNVGDVDLGTLNWSNIGRFRAQLSDGKYIYPNAQNYFVCEKYNVCDWTTFSNTADKVLSSGGSDARACYIDIKDSSYTDAQSFKSAMSGVKLQYELKVPTTRAVQSKYLEAGLTFHDEYGRSLTSAYKEEILTDVIDIESSGIGTATDEIWVNRASTNLWDEEWEVGGIREDGFPYSANDRIRSKNFIAVFANTSYFFRHGNGRYSDARIAFYDKSKKFISAMYQGESASFLTPQNCSFIKFHVITGTTYNHDVTIVEGTSGEYEPYAKGKVISIKRIGSVDLGTLGWQKTSGNLFYSIIDDVKQGVGTWGTVLGMCTKYVRNPISALTLLDKEFCIGSLAIESSGKNIAIREDSQSDPTTFKQSLSGTMLYYELANPVITDITNTSLGQALLTKTYPNSNHRISIDFGSIDVQWFEAK